MDISISCYGTVIVLGIIIIIIIYCNFHAEYLQLYTVPRTNHVSISVVPKLCPADLKGSATSFQGIHGNIFLMATLKLIYFCN